MLMSRMQGGGQTHPAYHHHAGWVRGQAGADLGQVLDTFQPDIEIVTLNYRGG